MRIAFGLVVVACGSAGVSSEKDTPKPKLDPCSPAALNLPAAKPLERWKAPDGCTVNASGTQIYGTEAEARAVVDCAPGIDFTKHRLLISDRQLSPASVGFNALDDGKTITFVSLQRPNCPDDPRPMPMPFTVMFLVDAGGDRAFGDAACTLERKCP